MTWADEMKLGLLLIITIVLKLLNVLVAGSNNAF